MGGRRLKPLTLSKSHARVLPTYILGYFQGVSFLLIWLTVLFFQENICKGLIWSWLQWAIVKIWALPLLIVYVQNQHTTQTIVRWVYYLIRTIGLYTLFADQNRFWGRYPSITTRSSTYLYANYGHLEVKLFPKRQKNFREQWFVPSCEQGIVYSTRYEFGKVYEDIVPVNLAWE